MLLQLARGRHVRPAIGEFLDHLWMSNYEESVFLELDAIRGAAQPAMMAADVAMGQVA
jgi:hypothetical protein